jgi:hypothetical protein
MAVKLPVAMFPASGRAAQTIGFVLAVVVLLTMAHKKKTDAASQK